MYFSQSPCILDYGVMKVPCVCRVWRVTSSTSKACSTDEMMTSRVQGTVTLKTHHVGQQQRMTSSLHIAIINIVVP